MPYMLIKLKAEQLEGLYFKNVSFQIFNILSPANKPSLPLKDPETQMLVWRNLT